MKLATPDEVHAFWFGDDPRAVPDALKSRWFRKDAAFDDECRTRFAATNDAAVAGALDHWARTPRGALSLVLVLDQLSRNIHRDTPRAFTGDARALAVARDMVWRRWDHALAPHERGFVYLPFEHAESLAMQREALRLFAALDAFPETADLSEWARRHHAVIQRFGRFPHRNAILGRISTPAETAFLATPGSRF